MLPAGPSPPGPDESAIAMFGFFKKQQEQRQAAAARARALSEVLRQFQAGSGVPLETALALHLAAGDDDSLANFLATLGGADVWILNKSAERLGEPAVTAGSDGRPSIAVFTSQQRAAAAAATWQLTNNPAALSTLELVFALEPAVGMFLNPDDPHVHWDFSPEHVANLRQMFERSFHYQLGGIYSVWGQGAFRAAKLLAVDAGGVHLRLFGNTFAERPKTVDPDSLTLDSTGSARAIGHMPLARPGFLAMGPRLLTSAPVTEEELEGYQIWADAKGGYFGA